MLVCRPVCLVVLSKVMYCQHKPAGTPRGQASLCILGKICFLNTSALCLSHTAPLARVFLFGQLHGGPQPRQSARRARRGGRGILGAAVHAVAGTPCSGSRLRSSQAQPEQAENGAGTPAPVLSGGALGAVRQLCSAANGIAGAAGPAAGGARLPPRGLVNTGNLCFVNSILQARHC